MKHIRELEWVRPYESTVKWGDKVLACQNGFIGLAVREVLFTRTGWINTHGDSISPDWVMSLPELPE